MPERRLYALGLRLFAISCLSVMTIFLKLAGEHGISTPEMMFWRQAFAVPVVAGYVAATTGLVTLKTSRLPLHATRALLGTTTMALTFSSYILLPLAEATTIGFTVPIFATLLAALVFREPTGWHRWGAVICGFLGVLIIVQPGHRAIPAWGVGAGLGSAVLVALISFLIKEMSKTEAATTIAFWFSLIGTIFLTPFLFWFGEAHDQTGWLYLIAIGTLGGIGQMALTSSLQYAPVSVVIGMDYVALLWTALGGWLLWGVLPVSATWIGGPIIIASGAYIAWREHRLRVERGREGMATPVA